MEEIKFEKVPEGIFDKVKTNKEEFMEKFINELEEFFPDTVKDGKVDFQALLERFGEYEDRDEKYELTWVGKNKARQESFEDIVGRTLKYIEEDSKNPETTENLYIEGDNLEVLKLLRKSYYGKIKMIYIDPPYNTGNDFVYKDNFTMTKEEYDKLKGDVDEYGNRLVKNSADSGRYHSNWLNMMYPRLQVAKDLLTDDGVIFISIDDNEVHNMREICDEVFGEKNFIEYFLWTNTETPPSLADKSRKTTEFVLCYEKQRNNYQYFGDEIDNCDAPLLNTGNPRRTLTFPKNSIYFPNIKEGVEQKGDRGKVELLNKFEIDNYYNKEKVILNGEFKWTQETVNNEINLGTFFLIKSNQFSIRYQRKDDNLKYKAPKNYMDIKFDKENNVKTNEQAIKELEILGMGGCIDYPKPISLLIKLLKMILKDDKEAIILDFFSGSATTAHAVMDFNAEDEGNRKYIMVQLPEKLDENLEKTTGKAKKTTENGIKFLDSIKKPHYLTEIGKERIRRSSKQVKEKYKDKEGIENLDTGFKVFRVEDTNFKRIVDTSIGADIAEMKYKNMKDSEDFNPHFTDLDVVYELILRRQDIELTEEIKKLDNIGDRTYIVGDTMLVCLEEKISEEMVDKIGNIDTDLSWIVLRDSAFDDDCDLKVNTTRKLRTIIKESRKKDQKIYWI